ncbi:peptidase M42 [Candidatus Epulonipiscium fishelsonii]|uniref:Peptidase M42 n=1 Tax=Candidatus Epulonipiscium fishelsonii TaxID=77094 RepID=A0ACC8XAR4_9FIRM|nr:peptidase M42 [Epulopiscium sp. SCG-B11WGA-EpuloA1]ONI41977.1 peptidase M42 [Epulopiscium sp. SCG-B05WGA-EpuloA1]
MILEILKLVEELSNANGISGFEDDVLKVIRKHAPQHCEISEDSMRNLYLTPNTNTGDKPVVMLDAHSDEVGFMVRAIRPNGLIQFVKVGGWVESNVPAHLVRIINSDGEVIIGVVASKPPHYVQSNDKLSIETMNIDIGARSRAEVIEKYKINLGAPIIPDVSFYFNDKNDAMLGKAFDCRLGCAALVETLKILQNDKLDVDLVGMISSQEEVGTRGAIVGTNRVKPDIAIIFEGSPADDTFESEYLIQTALHKGPMLRHIDLRMITNPRFQRFALDIAKEYAVPVQQGVRTGGATNGASIHISNMGIPSIVIGMPVRYAHTHYGVSSISDLHNSITLAEKIIKRLNADIISGF